MDLSRREVLTLFGGATLAPMAAPKHGALNLPITLSDGVTAASNSAGTDENGGPQPKLTQADIQRWAKELSNWGRWGTDDELGAVNLITPKKRIEAAALVKQGLSISLAHNDSTEAAVDNQPPFGHKMLTTGGDASADYAFDQFTVAFHTLYITHLDALCHVFAGDTLYNGFPRRSVTAAGAQKLDVVQLKNGIFTRGILFDIPRLKGRDYLDAGEAIYPEDLDRWERQAGVTVEPGDVVLVRTGRWARRAKLGPMPIPRRAYTQAARAGCISVTPPCWEATTQVTLCPLESRACQCPSICWLSPPWACQFSTTATWKDSRKRRRRTAAGNFCSRLRPSRYREQPDRPSTPPRYSSLLSHKFA